MSLSRADQALCCHSTSNPEQKTGVQDVTTDAPGKLVDEPVTCCCEKGGSSACMNWNGGSSFSDEPPSPYANHTHTRNLPYITTTNATNTTSSHSYPRKSTATSSDCMCRKVFSSVEVWLDGLPHPTKMANVNLPPNQMTTDEKRTIQRLATSRPDRERFYARPSVKVALRAPPSQMPDSSEDEDDGNETRPGEEVEDEGEGKPKGGFFKKLRKLGSRKIRYRGRKESSPNEDTEDRDRLTKRRTT